MERYEIIEKIKNIKAIDYFNFIEAVKANKNDYNYELLKLYKNYDLKNEDIKVVKKNINKIQEMVAECLEFENFLNNNILDETIETFEFEGKEYKIYDNINEMKYGDYMHIIETFKKSDNEYNNLKVIAALLIDYHKYFDSKEYDEKYNNIDNFPAYILIYIQSFFLSNLQRLTNLISTYSQIVTLEEEVKQVQNTRSDIMKSLITEHKYGKFQTLILKSFTNFCNYLATKLSLLSIYILIKIKPKALK